MVVAYFSQKASISELKALLAEEREQRKEEREKAATDLKISIQRIQAEAQQELQRLSDAAEKREKEQQEMINKLQVLIGVSRLFLSFFRCSVVCSSLHNICL